MVTNGCGEGEELYIEASVMDIASDLQRAFMSY